MALFPFPLGGVSFEEQDRYERAMRLVRAMAGEGGYTERPESAVSRTFYIWALLAAGISLATTRMIENIFPTSAHPEDLLQRHEEELNVVVDSSATVEQRWVTLGKVCSDRGGGTIAALAAKLSEEIGAAVLPVLNLAADLDAHGFPRSFMFAVAFQVPIQYIETIGQVRHLDNILAKYKPTTVGAVVARSLVFTDPMMTTHLGFLTDDDYSLTDRDVLDQTQ